MHTMSQLFATFSFQLESSLIERPLSWLMLMPVVTVVMSIRTLIREASQPSPRSPLVPMRHLVNPSWKNSVIIIE